MRAEATFSLCELACEKYPLQTTVQFSIAKFVTRFANKINRPSFGGIKKLRQLWSATQDSRNPLNRSRTGKNPVFFTFIRPDFWTDLNGCRQRLLFTRQLTQRKCSLCSQGKFYLTVTWPEIPWDMRCACTDHLMRLIHGSRSLSVSLRSFWYLLTLNLFFLLALPIYCVSFM